MISLHIFRSEQNNNGIRGLNTITTPVSQNVQSMAPGQQQPNSSFGIQSCQYQPGPQYQQYSNNSNQIHGTLNFSQNCYQQSFNTSNSAFSSHVPPSYHLAPQQRAQFSGPQPFNTQNFALQNTPYGNPDFLPSQASAPIFPPQNLVSGYRGLFKKRSRPPAQSSHVAPNYSEKTNDFPVSFPGFPHQYSPSPEYQYQQPYRSTPVFNYHQKSSSTATYYSPKVVQSPQTTLHQNQKPSLPFQANSNVVKSIATASATKFDPQNIFSQKYKSVSHSNIETLDKFKNGSSIQIVNPDTQTRERDTEEEDEDLWEWEYKAVFQEPRNLETVELAQPLAAGFKSTPVPLLQTWSSSTPSISRYARKENLKEFTRGIRFSPQWSYLQEDPAFSDEELDASFIPFNEILAWIATRHEPTFDITDVNKDIDVREISCKRVRIDDSKSDCQNQAESWIIIEEYYDEERPPAKKQRNEQVEKSKTERPPSPTPATPSMITTCTFDTPLGESGLTPCPSKIDRDKTEAILESLGVTGTPKPRIIIDRRPSSVENRRRM
ncbi:hypothetical protein K3495_g11364 [Podosphaera aphanis]|nr:hypothetical protein K3495_g11364 [Podosphaera aphanis]